MKPSKQEIKAISLISSAVDDVLSHDEKVFFHTWLDQSSLVQRMYREQKLVKELLRKKAAETVQLDSDYKIMLIKRSIELAKVKEIDQNLENKKPRSVQQKISYFLLAVAAIVMFVWLGSIFSEGSLSEEDSFEYFAASTFLNNNGSFVKPTWDIFNAIEAERAIKQEFDYEVHIPQIRGAEFVGVVEISDDLDRAVPMLEYHQKDIDEYIYLFTFELSKSVQPGKKRLKEAIFNCRTNTDYYVCELNGRHVVSWKWDKTWYSAVSNHNGNDLAALVKPLNAQ